MRLLWVVRSIFDIAAMDFGDGRGLMQDSIKGIKLMPDESIAAATSELSPKTDLTDSAT